MQSKQAHDDRLMVAMLMRKKRKKQVHPNQDPTSKDKSARALPGFGTSPKPLWIYQSAGIGMLQRCAMLVFP